MHLKLAYFIVCELYLSEPDVPFRGTKYDIGNGLKVL
jgi:hypothetical protein